MPNPIVFLLFLSMVVYLDITRNMHPKEFNFSLWIIKVKSLLFSLKFNHRSFYSNVDESCLTQYPTGSTNTLYLDHPKNLLVPINLSTVDNIRNFLNPTINALFASIIFYYYVSLLLQTISSVFTAKTTCKRKKRCTLKIFQWILFQLFSVSVTSLPL